MSSLVDIVRSRFLETIRSVNPPGRWKIVVVDEYTQRLMSATLKQYDVLQENVTSIESIANIRPQQSQEALYLLMPTTQNVERVISDFSNGKRQYGGAHLFFIEGLPDDLARSIVQSAADPHVKNLKDLYINFWPTEAQAFSLQSPSSFFNFFSPVTNPNSGKVAKARLEEELHLISKSICNVCITLGEYPYVRYYNPSHHPPLGPLVPPPMPKAVENQVPSRWRTNLARGPEYREHEEAESNHLSKVLASFVQSDLDEFKKLNPDFGRSPDGSRQRGTLIITDRSMDTIAPLVHEFTYQAMCNDLLPIKDGATYTYKFQSSVGTYEDKAAVLSDADNVWTTVRHMHMREAIDKLMADFNAFLQENAGFKGEEAATLNDMKDMLANLPQYQEQREKFSLHLNMAQECMNIFEQQKLPAAAQVEQECATGLTAEGKTPKMVVEEMVPLLDSREISNAIKARIIALYIQYRDGVPDEDRRRLYQHARLPPLDQDTINSLIHLGVRLSRASGDRDTKKRLKPKKAVFDSEYELSRYKPLLQTVIEDHCANKLDGSAFPYLRDSPTTGVTAAAAAAPQPPVSLRRAKPSWHLGARPGGATAEIRPRVIVFIAGGMTYSEMRTAYQLSDSLRKDIYIGSTHTLTPQHFLEDLRVLELGGVGSKALPKGVSLTGPDRPRSFQACYDQKYFTKDLQPSRPATAPPQSIEPSNLRNKLRPPPSPSGASIQSTSSLRSTRGLLSVDETKEKEKKKNFFRF